MLPWSNFCRDAFSKNNADITIVDQFRFTWKCDVQFVKENNGVFCKIGGDWRIIFARHVGWLQAMV
jgi:hypothetical protein